MTWRSAKRTMGGHAPRLCAWRAAMKARSRNCTDATRRPCSRCPDRQLAEEAAADAWLGCWRSARAFRGDSRVLTWLLGITKRQVYVRMRRARPVECALDDGTEQLADETGDALEVLLAQAGLDEIVAALDALEPALAETVRLAWLHELPYAEIAQVTDVPVGTVKSRVSRARALLQKTLGRRV